MFNDKYGLTHAVLEGRKTMTRRIVALGSTLAITWDCATEIDRDIAIKNYIIGNIKNRYKVGEVVAIAQSYADCGNMPDYELDEDGCLIMPKRSGFFNKMFVKADLMPHRIEITRINVERLQDISDEDCLKEGIIKGKCGSEYTHFIDAYYVPKDKQPYCTPRDAFEVLMDKVSGKRTWESNPYVWVYGCMSLNWLISI